MGDEGDIWNEVREHNRKQKEKRQARERPVIENKVAELSKLYPMRRLTDYQVRFAKCLDIYPENKRYHVLCDHLGRKNERGDYKDMTWFVKDFFTDHKSL